MNNADLETLIAEYNANELAQQERLTKIYREMRDRPGSGRFVLFGNRERWTAGNSFHPMEERFSLPQYVDSMIDFITEFQLE